MFGKLAAWVRLLRRYAHALWDKTATSMLCVD